MEDGVAGTIPVLAQRAASEGPRWTRAVGIIPPTPYKVTARCGLAERPFLSILRKHFEFAIKGVHVRLKDLGWPGFDGHLFLFQRSNGLYE